MIDIARSASAASFGSEGEKLTKPKIFIIEDQDDIRQLLEIFFRQTGEFEIHAAAEPFACPLYLSDTCQCPQESSCGDILLCDNYLPQMTGLEFIQRQMAKGCKGSIRNKAVMSAGFSPGDVALAEALGCKLFSKPFRLSEVMAWVRSVLAAPAALTGD